MRFDRFQYHEDDDEHDATASEFLLSEEAQFTQLEKSFREVDVWFLHKFTPKIAYKLTREIDCLLLLLTAQSFTTKAVSSRLSRR